MPYHVFVNKSRLFECFVPDTNSHLYVGNYKKFEKLINENNDVTQGYMDSSYCKYNLFSFILSYVRFPAQYVKLFCQPYVQEIDVIEENINEGLESFIFQAICRYEDDYVSPEENDTKEKEIIELLDILVNKFNLKITYDSINQTIMYCTTHILKFLFDNGGIKVYHKVVPEYVPIKPCNTIYNAKNDQDRLNVLNVLNVLNKIIKNTYIN